MSDQPELFLDSTLGAAFVGMLLAGILHGISMVQTWYYFTHQNDRWHTKLLASTHHWSHELQLIEGGLITHTVYTYTISSWGKMSQLDDLVWSVLVSAMLYPAVTNLISPYQGGGSIQRSNCSPGTKLLDNARVAVEQQKLPVNWPCVAAEFGCVIAFTGLSLRLKTFTELAELEALSIAVNALAAAGDVLIAVTLCIILHFSRTGFSKSDTMINKLILFSVNTGMLTSICAVGSLISITVAGNTFFYIAFFFCIGRLYTNSLLATLNARKMIRGALDGVNSTSENLSLSLRDKTAALGTCANSKGIVSSRSRVGPFVSYRPRHLNSQHTYGHSTNISIKIDTTKEFATDSDQEIDLGCSKGETMMGQIRHAQSVEAIRSYTNKDIEMETVSLA
ncbi:hypothetical protein FA15DRAFT_704533 [Coprinopsis marcescibilis]|uniref:DUF6534 domain-containing protein n=1 Tax=Coprinopsis marcescibilis TaxID=230819 RepID=A0A5C3KWG2_COPMA|nr:hypothetical protein FA15DRAFT_704533 [Coprinopsis marcescibilis]